jgi:hypothetical protein
MATEIDVWDYLTILKEMRYFRQFLFNLNLKMPLAEYTTKELHLQIDLLLEDK